MPYLKKVLLIVLISSVFTASSIVFYRYTTKKLDMLKQEQAVLLSYNNRFGAIKNKMRLLKKDENIIKNINMKVMTNFQVTLSSNSLKQLVSNIGSLYTSGIVVVKKAEIKSTNSTLYCTIEGFRLGL